MKNFVRSLVVLTIVACLGSVAFSQSPAPAPAPASMLTNIYAAGVSYNNAGTPSVAGTALQAHLLSDGTGTYEFTVADFLPTSVKPFTVTSNVSTGAAQKLFTVGSVTIYAAASAGVSFSGSNTGWAWSSGVLAPLKLKKTNWYAFPTVRVVKSSVSGATGYQVIPTILFGRGK